VRFVAKLALRRVPHPNRIPSGCSVIRIPFVAFLDCNLQTGQVLFCGYVMPVVFWVVFQYMAAFSVGHVYVVMMRFKCTWRGKTWQAFEYLAKVLLCCSG
jgi:hypothetical protein